MRPTTLMLAAALAAGLVLPAPALARHAGPTPTIVFPLVGRVTQWHDDFGEARPIDHEQGNDVGANPGTPLVAVVAGTVEKLWWGGGGWAIRLTVASGDQFMYLHMGRNGNRKLAYVPGLENGQHVAQGQQIGWSGFSGNATAAFPHVEFQYLPGGKHVVDPYRMLQAAPHLLFVAPPAPPGSSASPVSLELQGRISWMATGDSGSVLRLLVARARVGTGAWNQAGRPLLMSLDPAVTVMRRGVPVSPAALEPGDGATVWTTPFAPTLSAQLGASAAMHAARIVAAPVSATPAP